MCGRSCKSFFLTPLQREDEHVGSLLVGVNDTGGNEPWELVSVVKGGCFLHAKHRRMFFDPRKAQITLQFQPATHVMGVNLPTQIREEPKYMTIFLPEKNKSGAWERIK